VEIDFFTYGYFRTANKNIFSLAVLLKKLQVKKVFPLTVLLKNRQCKLLYTDGCVKTTTTANHFSTHGFLNLTVSDSFPVFFKFSTKIEYIYIYTRVCHTWF
jgi:hypothetical protein